MATDDEARAAADQAGTEDDVHGQNTPPLDHVFVVKLVTTDGVELPQEVYYTPQGVLARADSDPAIARTDCWYIPYLGAEPVHKFSIVNKQMIVSEQAPQSLDLPELLPEAIDQGQFELVFMYDLGEGGPIPMEMRFDWTHSYAVDGYWTVTWCLDIWSGTPDQSPGSSAPVYGWASWLNGRDALVAYICPEQEVSGWAHIPGGAPASDVGGDDDAMREPQTWVEFAKKITAAVNRDSALEMTGQWYWARDA